MVEPTLLRLRTIWICGTIGTVGAAVGVCWGIAHWMGGVYEKGKEIVGNIAEQLLPGSIS